MFGQHFKSAIASHSMKLASSQNGHFCTAVPKDSLHAARLPASFVPQFHVQIHVTAHVLDC